MNEIASLRPAERVVRVTGENFDKSKVQSENAWKSGSKAKRQQTEALNLRAAESDLKSQIKSAEDIQATRGLLKKLEVGMTGKAKSERSKLETLKKELQDKITSAEIVEKQKTESESEAEKARRASVHADTISKANQRNFTQESSGEREGRAKVSWASRAVPIEVSSKMTHSLQEQLLLADQLKFYDSEDVGSLEFNKYQAEPKYLMPLPLINKLKQIIKADEKGYYRGADDKKINKVLIGITPLYEQIVKTSESKGVEMNEQLIIKAFTEGLNITKNIDKRSTWEFVKEKKGREIGSSDVGYYAASAATMQEFFNARKNIVGEARLPYILAYAAGELVNNAPAHVVLDLRNLISEAIPVEHNTGEKSPLGFGYSLTNNTFNLEGSSTYDKGVVDAFTQANEITLSVFDTLREKRRFDMERKFASGMGSGRPDFSRQTPKLVERK